MNASGFFIDTVTVATRAGYAGGKPTFNSQTTITARVEHKTNLIIDDTGDEKRSDHKFVTTSPVNQTDRVWLPGDNTGETNAARRPISVTKAGTKTGSYTLYEVYL